MIQWLMSSASILAAVVTVAAAILLFCCLGCSNCSHREKDDLFNRHEL
jgi:hypothetical protein